MLISTKPDTKGKEAVIFRSRQLSEFVWTPKGDIPVHLNKVGKTRLQAGEQQRGMLYSSMEPTDKFITENVSFETFLSVVANPDSALYHKDINGHNNSWAYFGLVCNGLVRYALDIPYRYSTKRWPTIPGMRKIADEASYPAERIELCDVLYAFGNGRNHVALITDILCDETGEICQIEVSEAVRPTCVRVRYDLETFYEKYKLFALWRYDFVDEVSMPDEEQNRYLQRGVPALPVIAVDCGDKANYRAYEEVIISAFADGENEIEVFCGDRLVETIVIKGRGKVTRRFDRGYYILKHKDTGKHVEFCVTSPEINYTKQNGKITVKVDSCDPESEISHMDFRERSKGLMNRASGTYYNPCCASLSKMEELTEEEKRTGVITRDIPSDAENFKIYFKNRYGIWTHTMISI